MMKNKISKKTAKDFLDADKGRKFNEELIEDIMKILGKEIPEKWNKHYAICPVCHGTGVMDDGNPCTNCNDVWYDPKGYVWRRKDNGEPCIHEYECVRDRHCYTVYRCKFCGTETSLDSSG